MSEEIRWFCGFDWASEKHHVCLLDAAGELLGEGDVGHGGAELSELCDWLLAKTGGTAAEIAVAIETTSGRWWRRFWSGTSRFSASTRSSSTASVIVSASPGPRTTAATPGCSATRCARIGRRSAASASRIR